MPVQKTEKVWHNGKWINWDDAKLHVLSHVVSYGSAVFEGIRCYDTKQGPAIFRLPFPLGCLHALAHENEPIQAARFPGGHLLPDRKSVV